MKLKERPLEWWKGRSFRYWCKADSKDERKINYTFNWYSIGGGHVIEHYTSDEPVDPLTMYRIGNSTIENLQLIDNEWYVVLNYGCV